MASPEIEERWLRLSVAAKRIDLDTEGRCEACVGGTMPAAVRRAPSLEHLAQTFLKSRDHAHSNARALRDRRRKLTDDQLH